MTTKEINKIHNRILDDLDQGELITAIELIQSFIAGSQIYSFQGKLDELKETYQYLLRYFVEGTKDPMQQSIYASIRAGLYELSDQIKHKVLLVDSPQVYYETTRNLSINEIELSLIAKPIEPQYGVGDSSQFEETLNILFNKIWTTPFLSESDNRIIKNILTSKTFPSLAKCQVVSALLLGLQVSFDKEKMSLLFDAAGLSDDEVKVRSLIGILLTLYTYRNRIVYYPNIQHRIEVLGESPEFKSVLKTIITRFILSKETEKVTDKLQKEIIPEMMKLSPKINPNNYWSEFGSDLSSGEMNPDWKDIYSDSKLAKKIEEYSHLQEEGMDVMHSTFIHLKHFSFFKNTGNWFLPFHFDHSAFKNDPFINNKTLETMMQASFMCNSDKYSLCFSLFQIPEAYRETMLNQLENQISDMNVQKAQELKTKLTKIEIITGQYIQDLYRFYKLFPRRSDFDDLFEWGLDFHNLPILKPYLSDTDSLLYIGEFYFRKGYFMHAQTIFEELVSVAGDEILYQKLGYCKQMNGDLEGALEAYLRSEMIHPDSKWLARRLAGCYRLLKKPEKALHYYQHYEKLNPEQTANQISMGHCHMELMNYDEALNYYFKADYLDPDSQKAWQAIAWCSFLCGKFEQAQKYYQKIIENEPSVYDYLNAGHTEWLIHNIQKAIEYYVLAVKKGEHDLNAFRDLFNQDIPYLIHAGADISELPLILDQVQFSIK